MRWQWQSVVIGILLVAVVAGVWDMTRQPGAEAHTTRPGDNLTEDELELYQEPLQPDKRAWHTECCAPEPFLVTTNRFGLRDDDFSLEKPANTTRVLVIGDAYTWGFGVNQSDRYTERVERRLNNDSEQRYEVINAGVPNWGMKDYYYFFRYRGMDFQPDIVVISFIWNDRMSEEQLESINRRAEQIVDNRSYNRSLSDMERAEEVGVVRGRLEREWYRQHPVNTSGFTYLTDIHRFAKANDVEPVYYAVDRVGNEADSFLKRWSDSYNTSIIYRPEAFVTQRDRYHVSEFNSDPNQAGHRLLAERLFKRLNPGIRG